jgi:hypothetical protein
MTDRIIVDVDETLLHRTTIKLPNIIPDYILQLDKKDKLYIYLRKDAEKFLDLLSDIFENVYIYSASNINILEKMFEELNWKKYIKNIWGYDNCYKYYMGSFGKVEVFKTIQKIKKLGNFNNNDRIHIIDDRPRVYFDLDNNCITYHVYPFNGYNNDNILLIIFNRILKEKLI